MNVARQIPGPTAPGSVYCRDSDQTIEIGLADESRLWALRESDPRAREELLNRYLAYAKSIAMKFRSQAETLDDLIQVASLGLINAVNRFDPDRGIPFIAFASPTITGELKRHFRDRTSAMRIPRSLYDRIGRVDSVVSDLTAHLNREPTVGEIAAELRIGEDEVIEAIEASHNRHPMSLDQSADRSNEESPAFADWLGHDDDHLELVEKRALIEDAVQNLSDQERLILRLRFERELTQSEIAKMIGRSQMHVSRTLRRILDRLRERIPAPVA